MGAAERLTVAEIEGRVVQSIDHVQRYDIAASLVGGRTVIDLGCGVGYGSAILAGTAERVVGVDVADEAVAEANSHYKSETTEFVASDGAEYLAANDTPGTAVVAFESIEHIEDLAPLVAQLKARAARGDLLVLSVPNSAFIEEENEFHVFNYSRASAGELFDRIGEHSMICQYLAEGATVVADDSQALPSGATWFGRPDPEAASHFIGIFNAPGAGLESIGTLSIGRPLTSRYMKELERSNRELRLANGGLWNELHKAAAPEPASAYGSAAAGPIARARDEGIQSELESLRATVAAMKQSPSWRLTAPLRALKRLFKKGPG